MTIRLPEIDFSIAPTYVKAENADQKMLFVGQMTTGTATPGALVTSIGNANEQDTLFGLRSMLAGMIRAAKVINKVSRMDAIPLADNVSGVPAVGTIAFSGTASEAGTYYVTIGSKNNHRYEINVTNLETATNIGAALVAAMTADTKCPASGVNTTGSVAVTAANDGTEGNYLTLRVEGVVTGITVTVTGMASGATNPTLTNLFDVIGDARYQTIVYPGSYDLTPLTTLLAARWNVDNNILDGIGIITLTDVAADIETVANALNDQYLLILSNKTVNDTYYKGSAIQELDNVQSSIFAAVRALRLTQDAGISQYVTSENGIKDNIGGPAIASLPYFNTPFATLPLIDFGKGFTTTEITALKTSGASVLANNPSNSSIIAGEIVTTYKTDPASNPDVSLKYCEYVDTASNIREYFYNNLRTRFAQSRLTGGDVQPNRNMANAAVIGAFLDGLYNDLGGDDYTLTQIGIDPLTGTDWRVYFKNNRTITLDLALGKATVTMIVPIVTQLRRIIVAMQIAFSANS